MNDVTLKHSSVLKQGVLLLVLIYLVMQGFYPDMERRLFWGEMLSLPIFFATFRTAYASHEQKEMIRFVHLWIFLIPMYGAWVTLVFWKDVYNPYYFWRSLVPFYYAVFFFLAYRWGPEILGLLRRYRHIVLIFALALVVNKAVSIGPSMALGLLWLGAQYKNRSRRFFWLTYALLGSLFLLRGQGGSIKITLLMLVAAPLLIRIGRWWADFQPPFVSKFTFKFLVLGLLLLSAVGASFLLGDIHRYMAAGQTQMAYTIEGIEGESEFTNENALWRLFMWVYVLGQFWEHPQGVGLGTPLLGDDMGKFFGWGEGDFEEMQFALGAHNSFLTLLGRFGIVALLFFFLAAIPLGQSVKRLFQTKQSSNRWDDEWYLAFGSLIVFLIAFVQAFFNMVIETPLYAAHFWFTLGLFVRLSGDYIAKQRMKNPAAV